MHIKIAPADVTAGPDAGLLEGQFTAYASVFGNIDSYGDIVQPGAFTKSLAAWDASPNTISVLWSHDDKTPFSDIGAVVAAAEDEHGLKVTGQLDLDNPNGAQTYRLLKGRRVTSMSFAYDVVDEAKDEASGANLLKELVLREVSVVRNPANPEAAVLAVKTAMEALGVKAGAEWSAKNEAAVRDAHAAAVTTTAKLKDVLAAIDASKAKEPEKASTNGPAKDEEPSQAKSEEPSRSVSVKADSNPQHLELLRQRSAP